jgi:hypothetical protein
MTSGATPADLTARQTMDGTRAAVMVQPPMQASKRRSGRVFVLHREMAGRLHGSSGHSVPPGQDAQHKDQHDEKTRCRHYHPPQCRPAPSLSR